MYTETFTATVQYDDRKGTAAADDSLITWLRDEGHAKGSEYLVGVEMFVSDTTAGSDDEPVWVVSY